MHEYIGIYSHAYIGMYTQAYVDIYTHACVGTYTHTLVDTHARMHTPLCLKMCRNGSRRTNAKLLTMVSSGEGGRIGKGVRVKRNL